MYSIRSYQEGYINRQVEIGNEVITNWKYQRQSNKKLIEELYSQDDFDPETRLYAFDNDSMVGFLPAKVEENDGKKIALYEFPIVLPHHEKAAHKLIKKSFEVLKDKEVDIIRARVSPHWGNTQEYAEQYGFEYNQPTLATAQFDPSSIDTTSLRKYDHIVEMDYDNEKHVSAFKESFVQRFPMRYEGEIEEWIQYYDDLNKATQLLYFADDTVEGHLVAVLREGQETKPVITAFYSQGKEQGRKIRQLMEVALVKLDNNEFETVSIALGTEQIDYIDKLEALGIEFTTQVSQYDKQLE